MNSAVARARLLLALALLLSLAACLSDLHHRHYLAGSAQTDFDVYFVAATMVHDHLSSAIYEDASTGVDPQLRLARTDSVINTEARRLGLPGTQLYVYPPFLADLLLPLSPIPLRDSRWIWRFINIAGLILCAVLISRLLGAKAISLTSTVVLAGILCFSPLWQGLHYGQVSILLFTLWCLGIALYAEGWSRTSAVVLSLAALIKLSPLLILVPFLIWGRWRWVLWFVGGLLAGFALMVWINSPAVMLTYFFHVIPPMSVGVVERQNQTVNALVQMVWGHGRPVKGVIVPTRVILFGRFLSVVLVALAAGLTVRLGRQIDAAQKSFVLACFALLSLCVSPLSWVDALVLGTLPLALLWQRVLRGGRSTGELLLVFASTVAMGASLGIKHIHRLDPSIAVQYSPVLLALCLIFYVLYRCRDFALDQPGRALGGRVV